MATMNVSTTSQVESRAQENHSRRSMSPRAQFHLSLVQLHTTYTSNIFAIMASSMLGPTFRPATTSATLCNG